MSRDPTLSQKKSSPVFPPSQGLSSLVLSPKTQGQIISIVNLIMRILSRSPNHQMEEVTHVNDNANITDDNGQCLPVTPTSQRTTNVNPRSATKTPTFAKGEKRRKPPPNRRQRAATPHPSSNGEQSTSTGDTSTLGGEIESATTSPQTTPEKPSRSRRKRRNPKKSKTEIHKWLFRIGNCIGIST